MLEFKEDPFLFSFYNVMFDVVTVLAREGVLMKMTYVDKLVLMCETIYGFRNKFCECDEVYENNGLKVNLMDTRIMLS